jgi:hypothetical protein
VWPTQHAGIFNDPSVLLIMDGDAIGPEQELPNSTCPP